MTAQPNPPAPDANDVLMGGARVPTAKFDQPGHIIGGRIVAPPKAHQEREYDRTNPGMGALKVFPSGDPIYGLTIDVQTQLRDPSVEDDTGVRRIYVEGKRLKEAVRNAVQQSGAAKLEVGGTLEVAFTGFGEAAGVGVNPPKEYQARYSAPSVGQADFFAQGQQPAQPPVQQQAPPPGWAAQPQQPQQQQPAPTPPVQEDPWAAQPQQQGQPAQAAPPVQEQQAQTIQLPPGVQMTPELQAALAAANTQPQG